MSTTHTAYRQKTVYKNKIKQRDNYICQRCGRQGDIADHITPWALSHDSSPENMRCLCRSCNLATRRPRKDACLPFDEWIAKIEIELNALQKEVMCSVGSTIPT